MKNNLGKKVILTEYSSGFAHYSWLMVNEFARYDFSEITYLTDKGNTYLNDIDKRVVSKPIYDTYADDDTHKKGSLRWLCNRISVTTRNCKLRNQYVIDHKPDVLIIEVTLSRFDHRYLKKLREKFGNKLRIILIVHDVIVPVKSESWNDSSLKKMYDLGDALVVHSESNKEQLVRIFNIDKNKIKVVPHGIVSTYNKLDKTYCRNKLGIKGNVPVLLFYGSIRQSKGLDVLLKALKGIDCILIISGKMLFGESFDQYQKIIDENNIKTIEYLKFTEDSFRDLLFQASDYLILPYKEFYSQSGVLMQSIRYHLPIIATDVGSFKEYIEKYQIGFVSEPNNVSSLHDAIEKGINAIGTVDIESNMQKAVNENCWEEAGKKYVKVINDEAE